MLAGVCLAALPASALAPPPLPQTPAQAPAVGAHDSAPHGPSQPVQTAAATELTGTFRVTAGSCGTAGAEGSWFRMIQPGGTPEAGPFVENADSPCADKTYTPIRPGTDGGLVSGSHQPQPAEPFDGTGNGTAARIVRPQRFFGVDFAVATNPTDPQTQAAAAAPVIRHDGGKLTGDLRAYAVAWNRQHFNQGAPKPDGSMPGQTRAVSGTIDTRTKAYTLQWASTIVGGPFNNFTGLWRLQGTFDGPVGDAQTTTPAPVSTPAARAGAPAAPGPSTPDTGQAVTGLVGLAALAAAAATARLRRRGDA